MEIHFQARQTRGVKETAVPIGTAEVKAEGFCARFCLKVFYCRVKCWDQSSVAYGILKVKNILGLRARTEIGDLGKWSSNKLATTFG